MGYGRTGGIWDRRMIWDWTGEQQGKGLEIKVSRRTEEACVLTLDRDIGSRNTSVAKEKVPVEMTLRRSADSRAVKFLKAVQRCWTCCNGK